MTPEEHIEYWRKAAASHKTDASLVAFAKMAPLARAEKVVIGAWIATVALIVWLVLGLVRDFAGRPAFWVLGFTFLLLAGLALFKLRKKV